MYSEPDEMGVCEIDYEVLIILAWMRAKREDSDIKRSAVADRIGARNAEQIDNIVRELWFFYTTFTREEVAERIDGTEEASDDEAENPTPTSVQIA